MAKLLREYNTFSYNKDVIKEAISGNKPVIVKALLQRADAMNQNKRVYPRAILEREVLNYKKAVIEGRACGELDHPDSSVVALENISHVIKDIYWKNDEVWGDVEILNTPKGLIARSLMESGVKLGISSRGVGEVNQIEDGSGDVVDETFMLICFDLVSEPSTHEAWLMSESKDVSVNQIRSMIPKTDRVNRIICDILKK